MTCQYVQIFIDYNQIPISLTATISGYGKFDLFMFTLLNI